MASKFKKHNSLRKEDTLPKMSKWKKRWKSQVDVLKLAKKKEKTEILKIKKLAKDLEEKHRKDEELKKEFIEKEKEKRKKEKEELSSILDEQEQQMRKMMELLGMNELPSVNTEKKKSPKGVSTPSNESSDAFESSVAIPSAGAISLSPKTSISKKTGTLLNQTKEEKTFKICEKCSIHVATLYCKDCHMNICEKDCDAVLHKKSLKSHKRINLLDIPIHSNSKKSPNRNTISPNRIKTSPRLESIPNSKISNVIPSNSIDKSDNNKNQTDANNNDKNKNKTSSKEFVSDNKYNANKMKSLSPLPPSSPKKPQAVSPRNKLIKRSENNNSKFVSQSCSNCGVSFPVNDDVHFCSKCGSPVKEKKFAPKPPPKPKEEALPSKSKSDIDENPVSTESVYSKSSNSSSNERESTYENLSIITEDSKEDLVSLGDKMSDEVWVPKVRKSSTPKKLFNKSVTSVLFTNRISKSIGIRRNSDIGIFKGGESSKIKSTSKTEKKKLVRRKSDIGTNKNGKVTTGRKKSLVSTPKNKLLKSKTSTTFTSKRIDSRISPAKTSSNESAKSKKVLKRTTSNSLNEKKTPSVKAESVN